MKNTGADPFVPRIALYKVLQTELPAEENLYAHADVHDGLGAAEKHAFTAKMEFVPGFYRIYSYCFLKIMRTSDLWESTQEHDKTHVFRVDYQVSLAHGVPGKRLSGAVSAVLRRG